MAALPGGPVEPVEPPHEPTVPVVVPATTYRDTSPPPVAAVTVTPLPPPPNPLITSLIRTIVPIIVGAALAWAVRQGVPVDESFRGPLTEILTAAFGAIYYTAARLLEHYVSPQAGLLLGAKAAPLYPPK
jgi:hypothetical protein